MIGFDPFLEHESEVRSYCRRFPIVLVSANGHVVRDENGSEYIDLLSGAGALNYGHNDPRMKEALIDYLSRDGIVHSLDLYTEAKREFLVRLHGVILKPRGLEYRVQFTGPTGTNAVEAAIKLARKVTGRASIAAFTNGFHGVTLGALSATGSRYHRGEGMTSLTQVTRMPFDGYLGEGFDSIAYIEKLLDDPSSGIDLPAAFLVETIQGEGGLNVASCRWLEKLQRLAAHRSILLIVDDIQAGCGRSGMFFSFERAKIQPDIVCLSKGLSGFGLPMAVLLIKPDLDRWRPGEHNGTFRGNNLAFISATVALDNWRGPDFEDSIKRKGRMLQDRLEAITERFAPRACERRGLCMMQGLRFTETKTAQLVCDRAFRHGVLTETCGPRDEVLKLLPPLTISEEALEEGLDRIELAIEEELGPEVLVRRGSSPARASPLAPKDSSVHAAPNLPR